jgi:hypothetical protein
MSDSKTVPSNAAAPPRLVSRRPGARIVAIPVQPNFTGAAVASASATSMAATMGAGLLYQMPSASVASALPPVIQGQPVTAMGAVTPVCSAARAKTLCCTQQSASRDAALAC